MLTLTHVTKTFNKGTVNEKPALTGVDLHLEPGDFVTVIGGNGAGKSTLLNCIAGVFPPDGGTIELDGRDVTRLPEHRRAADLGRVFQDPMRGTAADMQIDENLALAARRGIGDRADAPTLNINISARLRRHFLRAVEQHAVCEHIVCFIPEHGISSAPSVFALSYHTAPRPANGFFAHFVHSAQFRADIV